MDESEKKKLERKELEEKYGRSLAQLTPFQLLLWAIVSGIASLILNTISYLYWIFWLKPRIEAEVVRIKTEESHRERWMKSHEGI